MAGVGLSAGVTISFKKLLLRATRGRNRHCHSKSLVSYYCGACVDTESFLYHIFLKDYSEYKGCYPIVPSLHEYATCLFAIIL